MAYSALTNSRKIFTLRSRKSPEVFNCLDGIRAISTAWVVLGHSYYMHTIFPTENMTSILSVRIFFGIRLYLCFTTIIDKEKSFIGSRNSDFSRIENLMDFM